MHHQQLQQGAVSLPVIPTTLPKKSSVGGSKGFPQEALVAPSPSQNQAFLQSAAGRTARLVCELEEYPRRMSSFGIRGTFLVFGSARSKYGWQIDQLIDEQKALIEKVGKGNLNEDQKKKVAAANAKIASLEGLRWTAEWMEKTEALCHRLTEWALSPVGRTVGMHCRSNMLPNDYSSVTSSAQAKWYNGYAAPLAAAAAGMVVVDGRSTDASGKASGAITNTNNSKNLTLSYAFEQPLVVCSGGGPGFMEAANKGAYEANGVSMGVGITLPFETHLNSYVTPGLHFNTDYFFTRKFWEVFSAKAMIVCPGGMGTCDEMFEVLTLMQCGHSQMMPVVLLGKKFWTECINFPSLAKYNMISKKEVEDLCITDSVDEAFNFIVSFLIREAEAEKKKLATALKAKL